MFRIALLAGLASTTFGFRRVPGDSIDKAFASSMVDSSSCNPADLGHYLCTTNEAPGANEQIIRDQKLMLFKRALLAETWACLSAQCACDDIRAAVEAVGRLKEGGLVGKAFSNNSYPLTDCERATADFETQAAASDADCRCRTQTTYQQEASMVATEVREIERRAQQIADRAATRAMKHEVKDMTQTRIEAAVQECAPGFVEKEMMMHQQKEALKLCLRRACSKPTGGVDRRTGVDEAKVEVSECARDGFARGLIKIEALKKKAAANHAKIMASYNKN